MSRFLLNFFFVILEIKITVIIAKTMMLKSVVLGRALAKSQDHCKNRKNSNEEKR